MRIFGVIFNRRLNRFNVHKKRVERKKEKMDVCIGMNVLMYTLYVYTLALVAGYVHLIRSIDM